MMTGCCEGLRRGLLLGLGVLFICGCQDTTDEGVEVPLASDLTNAANDSDALPSASDTGGFVVPDSQENLAREFDGELRLPIPANWLDVEMTAMQRSVLLAKFEVPDVDPLIEVTVSSARGGIDANFERWQGQFPGSEPSEDKLDFDRSTARLLQLEGDYHPGFGKMNQTEWMLLGAAFPGKDADFYVKLTGPKDKVLELEKTIRELVKTAELIN